MFISKHFYNKFVKSMLILLDYPRILSMAAQPI